MSNYLVISPNGMGNIGDDLCALGGRYAIHQADPGAEVAITQPPKKSSLIDWADVIVISGGGVLYDRAPKNLENYMSYIDEAHTKGKKSVVLGVGVQGIVTPEGQARYRESLAKCEFISVRTDTDRQMLADIGINTAVTTFDPAFFLPQFVDQLDHTGNVLQKIRRRQLMKHVKNSQKPKIGICMINLRMLKGDKYDGVFKTFDDTVEDFVAKARNGFDIYFIQHAKEDGKLMHKLAKKYGVNYVPYRHFGDIPSIYALYNELDLFLGVRLHSIALGVMSQTPTFAIGSQTAKQKRLIDFALPSIQHQFFEFNDVERLGKTLDTIALEKFIDAKKPSDYDYQNIQERNQKNIELLRSLFGQDDFK